MSRSSPTPMSDVTHRGIVDYTSDGGDSDKSSGEISCDADLDVPQPSDNKHKSNNRWSDVLLEQQFTGGIKVMSNECLIDRGAETYDVPSCSNNNQPKYNKPVIKALDTELEVYKTKRQIPDNLFGDYHSVDIDSVEKLHKPEKTRTADASTRKRQLNDDKPELPPTANRSMKLTNRFARIHSTDRDEPTRKRPTRWIPDEPRPDATLILDSNVTMEILAEELAKRLKEPNLALLSRCVQYVGNSKCIEIYDNTMRIEKNGGMMTMDGSRRRTPGGIFLYLIQGSNSITKQQKDNIFAEAKEEKQNIDRVKRRLRRRGIDVKCKSQLSALVKTLDQPKPKVNNKNGKLSDLRDKIPEDLRDKIQEKVAEPADLREKLSHPSPQIEDYEAFENENIDEADRLIYGSDNDEGGQSGD